MTISFRSFLENFGWANDRGQPIAWSPILEAIAQAEEDPDCRECAVLSARRGGKSTAAAALSAYYLLAQPGSFGLWIAAAMHQSTDVFAQKFIGPLRRHPKLAGRKFEIASDRVYCPETGSTVLCRAPEESSLPGRTLSYLFCDEARSADAEVMGVLKPSLLGTGRFYAVSSAGAPGTWWASYFDRPPMPGERVYRFKTLRDAGNPSFSPKVFEDIERERVKAESIGPAAMALWRREHESEFSLLSDNPFLHPKNIARAEVDAIEPFDRARDVVYLGVDLSLSKDLSSIVAIAVRGGRYRVLDVVILDPATYGGQTPLELVLNRIRFLWKQYGARSVEMDRFQGAYIAQRLRAEGCPVHDFQPTLSTNMSAFEKLAEILGLGLLSWRKDVPRLSEELRGLTLEETKTGWRVTDGAGRLHRDVAFSAAIATAAAARGGEWRPEPGWSPGDARDASRQEIVFFSKGMEDLAAREKLSMEIQELEDAYRREAACNIRRMA